MPLAIAGRDAIILINGLNASDYLNEYEIEAEADDIEVTRFGAIDKEYLSGPHENTVTLTGHWTGDDDKYDDVIDQTYGNVGDQIVTICPKGASIIGSKAYLTPGIVVSNTVSAEADDVTEIESEFRASRVSPARILHPYDVARTTTGTGTAYTAAAATAKGGSAHLHVLSLTGTTPTLDVKIEHSADGTTWTDLLTFSQVTATGAKFARQVTSPTATVEKQVRASYTIAGTTPNAVFAVVFARHLR